MEKTQTELIMLHKKELREITIEKLWNLAVGRVLIVSGIPSDSVQYRERKKTFFAAFQASQMIYLLLPDAWGDDDDKCVEHLTRLKEEVDKFFENEVRMFNAQPR